MYLKLKDCAKILYDLYEDVFNRYDFLKVQLENKQIEQFSTFDFLTKEEIWAYSNKLVFLPIDEPYLARLDDLREGKIAKQSFVLMVAIPVYRICISSDPLVFTKEVNKFAIENSFFNGIFSNEEERKWFCFECESIRTKDAEKIVENIKQFFASRNC